MEKDNIKTMMRKANIQVIENILDSNDGSMFFKKGTKLDNGEEIISIISGIDIFVVLLNKNNNKPLYKSLPNCKLDFVLDVAKVVSNAENNTISGYSWYVTDDEGGGYSERCSIAFETENEAYSDMIENALSYAKDYTLDCSNRLNGDKTFQFIIGKDYATIDWLTYRTKFFKKIEK